MQTPHGSPLRIFLIGFMCAGKSQVGKLLAPLMNLPFVDIDRVVEQHVGPITPFVQKEGEAAFRSAESKVLLELLDGGNAVIATGGGTPCEGDNMDRMKAAGTTVWLDVPMPELMLRIERAGGDRPLLFGLKGAALQDRVRTLMDEREHIYAQADVIVQAIGTPAEVAERIRAAVLTLQAR